MNLKNIAYDRFIRTRRAACEAVGIGRYSWMSLNGLDRKLTGHINKRNGVFIEAGANDGILQSNTYYFERVLGWTGLLVEPIPRLADRCRVNRPNSTVVQAALVASHVSQATVKIHDAGLMSAVDLALGDAESTARHVAAGLAVQGLTASEAIWAPARTLSSIIDEARLSLPIDLLSLDVEGSETAVLDGLDLSRHAPRYICIEVRNLDEVNVLLGSRYRLVEFLHDAGTYRDVLFASK